MSEEEYPTGFDLGYLCCAIDGEGSMQIGKFYRSKKSGRPSYIYNTFITNNSLDFLELLKTICLGTGTIKPKVRYIGDINAKDSWYYRIKTEFFKKVMPYLLLTVKREHLEVAKRFFEIQESHAGRFYTKEELEELEQLYIRMKELNKRGKV